MTTDWRALCAELVDEIIYLAPVQSPYNNLIARARAALAEPEPEGPTLQPADDEVAELVAWLRETGDLACQADAEEGQRYWSAADLLERLGPPQPVPVAERLPGPEDCDAEGLCWVWNFTAYTWGLFRLDLTAHSHWLPAHALPLPS